MKSRSAVLTFSDYFLKNIAELLGSVFFQRKSFKDKSLKKEMNIGNFLTLFSGGKIPTFLSSIIIILPHWKKEINETHWIT